MSTILRLLCWLLRALRNFWLHLAAGLGARSAKCPYLSGSCKDSISSGWKSSEDVPVPFEDMPTAKGLPLVGTFFELIAAGAAPKLHKYIDKRHRELGAIFRERLGGTQDAVFVSSASLMRSVFLHEGQHPKHPLPAAWTLYNEQHKCQRGLFFMDGSEWLHNRRILNRFLLNGNMEWINEYIAQSTDRLISGWRLQSANCGAEFTEIKQLEQQLYRWAIDVICSIMFGSLTSNNTSTNSTSCNDIDVALAEFSQIVHKIFECSALLMNFPPKVAKLLNLQMWQDFESNVSCVLRKGSDIIDMYLALNRTTAAEHSDLDDAAADGLFGKLQAVDMPLDMIKRIFVDLVIAAGDTTAYTSEWALYLLSQDGMLQQRIAKEVVETADRPTVRGLIKETLRLYPVAPFIGRYMAADAVLGNNCIKKDTLVLLSLYTAGRSEEHFPQPLAVMPERWTRDPATGALPHVLQAHGTLPFAIGNRSCIGRKVANTQLEVLIAEICRNFELKCFNAKPIDCILRLVTVPDQALQLGVRLRASVN